MYFTSLFNVSRRHVFQDHVAEQGVGQQVSSRRQVVTESDDQVFTFLCDDSSQKARPFHANCYFK